MLLRDEDEIAFTNAHEIKYQLTDFVDDDLNHVKNVGKLTNQINGAS